TYDIYVEIGNYATSVNIHWDCTANATVSIYTSPTYSASKPSSVTDGVVYTMYSTHQKPTPLDIGALPTTGGTVSGPLSVTGGITGTLNGNASTATKLQTARSIGGVGFDGSANINLPGVNTTGNQNTTGNAATATKLQTARTIGGVSFDGTANINLPGVNTTGNQNTTGNAATATKLQTARTINGVSFDGSANIALSPANIGCPASPTGWLVTGDNGASITTEQLVTLLRDNGAFSVKAWIARCAWAYANSATIPNSETGCGVIPLAGAVIEVFNNGSSSNNYTIRITTATTTSVSGALTNAEFIYVFNGTDYSPGWRRVYNTKNKPTASDVGALPLTGGTLSGGLTSSGEIISKYANGFRIAYGSFGFFIRNDGSNTYFMLTASGDTLGSWNGLRPITINNTSGVVSIGNGLNVTGGVNGSLNGNASTATKLQTARNINGVRFDGSGDININTLVSRGRVTALSGSTQGTAGIQMYEAYNNSYPTAYGNVLHMKGASAAGEGELLIGWSGTSGAHAPVFIRSRRDHTDAAWSAWAQVYTSRDSIPGVNATGNQNTTGNAATATKLQTARTIGGVSFDGTANINLPGVNVAGNQNTSGNAATATKLQTARTINGVLFDGSKNIELTPRSIGTINSTTMSFSGGTGWFKLATVTMPQSSSVVYISLIGGSGYNVNSPMQAGISELVLRAGNGNPKGLTGALWRRTSVGFTNFAWVNTSGDTYDVYVEIGNYTTRVNIQWDYTSNASVTIHTSPSYTANKPTGLTDGTVYVIYSSHIKPTATDVGALPITGGNLNGGLTATGEIISKSANGLRIAYGNYGFFIRNDGSNTYFMLTNSGNSLGTYNNLRPLIINNANGTVTIGNGLNVTGGINGSLNGNAATATKLQTVRTIGGVSFDGSANIDLPGVNKTGNQSTTGNAATATKLQTARTIGGVSFDGSANIDLPGVNKAGNQSTTGNAATATKLQTARTINGVKFDGSANITLTAANLGLSDSSGYVGRLVNTRVFTSSGTYTPTPGTKRIRVTITGGGGGGGGCQATSNNETFFGAGGGAGGTIISIMTPTQNSYPVTIGAGGGGGVGATNGLKGGDSSFGTVIAPGGEGGGKVGVTNTNGGNGGAPNTGDVRIIGGHGGDGQSGNISVSGEGGSSFWGGGGRAGAGGGVIGRAYGSGGGGAYDAGYSGTSMTGGKGAAGICIIEEFA
ncbi:beta strand repeat-containing protein, partial [Escherichia coli]|uniref:beta strand repeat-containing protein n=1 Tax=Escherichia coli TaxID=562 RepID=UPI00385581AC